MELGALTGEVGERGLGEGAAAGLEEEGEGEVGGGEAAAAHEVEEAEGLGGERGGGVGADERGEERRGLEPGRGGVEEVARVGEAPVRGEREEGDELGEEASAVGESGFEERSVGLGEVEGGGGAAEEEVGGRSRHGCEGLGLGIGFEVEDMVGMREEKGKGEVAVVVVVVFEESMSRRGKGANLNMEELSYGPGAYTWSMKIQSAVHRPSHVFFQQSRSGTFRKDI